MATTNRSSLIRKLISLLLDRSLEEGDFVLSSGRRSPFYVDARRTTMSSEGLELIGALGLATIREEEWAAELIGGLTLGADPIAYAIALASRHQPPALDAFTVRKEAKAHGTRGLIEGCFEAGKAVIVVEDTLTTGGSVLYAAQVVAAAGGLVQGVLALVDREEGGADAVRGAGYPLRSLVTLRDLAGR